MFSCITAATISWVVISCFPKAAGKVWHQSGIKSKAQTQLIVLFKDKMQFVEFYLDHSDVICVFVRLYFNSSIFRKL